MLKKIQEGLAPISHSLQTRLNPKSKALSGAYSADSACRIFRPPLEAMVRTVPSGF